MSIVNLLEQGEFFDQDQLRFDDFVTTNTDSLPTPDAQKSMAISYGITAIPLEIRRDDRATHYLELALRTAGSPPPASEGQAQLPVNYMFVVDTSGSMEGTKLESIKSAIGTLVSQMKEDDVVGIVEFNELPRTTLPPTRVGVLDVEYLRLLVSQLTAEGGTDINLGLSYGLIEIGRPEIKNEINQVYLFSDGNPTSGEENWAIIRGNLDKQVRAVTRDDSFMQLGSGIRLSAFGFGADANIRELNALVGLTGGSFSFVTDASDISLHLQEQFVRDRHLAVANVQLQIRIDPEIEIWHLYGHDQITDPVGRAAVIQELKSIQSEAESELDVEPAPNIIAEEEGITIFVPNLATGETYFIVFEIAIPHNQTRSVGDALIQYIDIMNKENVTEGFDLTSGKIPSDTIVEHALGLWSSEVIFYALDDLRQRDLNTASTRIEQHIALLSQPNVGFSSPQLSNDITTLRKFSVLAQNLPNIYRHDESQGQNTRSYFEYFLTGFGQVRNGYNRTSFPSRP